MIELAQGPAEAVHPGHALFERLVTAHIEVYALVLALMAIAGIAVIH